VRPDLAAVVDAAGAVLAAGCALAAGALEVVVVGDFWTVVAVFTGAVGFLAAAAAEPEVFCL